MTVHTPIETRGSGVPPWAIGIAVFVFLVGGVYLASNLGGENPPFAVPGSHAAGADRQRRGRTRRSARRSSSR